MRTATATLHINLDALAQNYLLLADKAHTTPLAAVVKANAYGLGVQEVAEKLVSVGCEHFFVAHFAEACELRAFVPDDIFIGVFHGVANTHEAEAAVQARITPVLNHHAHTQLWAEHGAGKPCILHIDSGMNRLGFNIDDDIDLSGLDVAYVMSHFYSANEADEMHMSGQFAKLEALKERFKLPICAANSAALWLDDKYRLDMARAGISLYGSQARPDMPLKVVATLKAPIIQLREVSEDGYVGYGATASVKKGQMLAVLPVGYADGYSRMLSNKGRVWIAGHYAPVVGRVSMDMIIVDVTGLDVALGDEAELLGAHCTLDEVAEQASTIGYEILTQLGGRYMRVYEG